MFAATLGLRLLDGDESQPVSLLFALPIALVAAELGIRWGLGAAGLALGLFAGWAGLLADGGHLGSVDYFTHGVTYLLLGGLVGSFAGRSRRAADNYRELYETPPIGYHSLDREGVFVDINRTELSWLGYRRDQVVGKLRFADLLTAESRRTFEQTFPVLTEGGYVRDLEFEMARKDGTTLPILLSATAVTDVHGNHRISRSTVIDITERKGAEEAAQSAVEDAERANRAKSEFLSRMSHELRTPLNSILGFAQLLELDELEPPQRESVKRILKGGRHLVDLVDEVLDISRIEANEMAISPEPVQVREAVAGAVELVRPMAVERGVRLEVDPLATDDRYVRADRQRLTQVLLNLLSNAVKYNREGGSVTVSVAEHPGDRVRVLVSDTGYGIPPGRLETVFAPFERLGEEEVEGVGLGLALSKRLAELMGGALSAESEPEKGSTFCLELSRAVAPTAVEPAEHVTERRYRRRFAPTSRRVLCIEDNVANIKLIREVLSRRPEVKLLPAISGGLGLELARQHRPDLILLDLHLPGISGHEVLKRLKEGRETAAIPVVVTSADATPRQGDRLIAAGAHAYLTKPLDVRQLLELVDEALDRAVGEGREGTPDLAPTQ